MDEEFAEEVSEGQAQNGQDEVASTLQASSSNAI